MNNNAHIMLATSASMTIAFILHCALHQTRVDNSIIQQYIYDVMREYLLAVRCWFDGRNEYKICLESFIGFPDGRFAVFIVCVPVILFSLILFGQQLGKLVRPIVETAMIVWLLGRFCEGKDLFYVPDILTVYCLVWQCAYIMCKWEDHDLSFPLVILQQGLFCIVGALNSFLLFDFTHRFYPIELSFTLLWLWAFYDTVCCLHINGWFRNRISMSWDKRFPPGSYYPYDFENITIHKYDSGHIDYYINGILVNKDKNKFPSLGMGDFLGFNMMGMLAMDPLWPITIKIYVFIGCVISIQIGFYMMIVVHCYWQEICMPGLPLSIITFSIYYVLIHSFVINATIESANIQSCI